MRRRDFIAGLAGTVAWPMAALAQQAKVPVIGFVGLGSSDTSQHLKIAFEEGLGSTGYVNGRNVTIEYWWAQEQPDRLPSIFAQLVAHDVAAIVTGGNVPLRMAKAATSKIPVIFYLGTDPVAMGYVASLNRPGANLTGVSLFNVSLGAKQLELLHQVVRGDGAFAILSNSENPSAKLHLRDIEEAARKLGRKIVVAKVSSASDLTAIFGDLARNKIDSILVDDDAFFNSRRRQIAELAARYMMAAIYSDREAAAAGVLMSYGSSITTGYRQCGIYVARILNGERAADLPIIQPTKFELVINLKTATALGLTIPETLLATADELIQ